MTDEQMWLAGIRSGQLTAFDALYRALVPSLMGFACQLAPRPAAEDAVQDVMLDFWTRRNAVRINGSVRGYLFGAVRRRLADSRRRARMAERVTARIASAKADNDDRRSPATATPLAAVESGELQTAVQQAIATLPPQSRLILTLRWQEGFTYPEIAEALGISLAAAKKQGRRMELVLRTLLDRFAPR